MTKNKAVLVPFPFDDLTGTKLRPAVCLTDPIGQHRHVVLAFITSRPSDSPLPTDITPDQRDVDSSETGLRVSSMLQLHRVMTATTALIYRELGVMSPRLQAEIDKGLRHLFGLFKEARSGAVTGA